MGQVKAETSLYDLPILWKGSTEATKAAAASRPQCPPQNDLRMLHCLEDGSQSLSSRHAEQEESRTRVVQIQSEVPRVASSN